MSYMDGVQTWEIGAHKVEGKTDEEILKELNRDPHFFYVHSRTPLEKQNRRVYHVTIGPRED